MGWKPAREASGEHWLGPLLASKLTDSYFAVRLIAHRPLKRLPGFEDFAYDAFASAEEREAARDRAFSRWEQSSEQPAQTGNEAVLIGRSGILLRNTLLHLEAQQDRRRVDLQE